MNKTALQYGHQQKLHVNHALLAGAAVAKDNFVVNRPHQKRFVVADSDRTSRNITTVIGENFSAGGKFSVFHPDPDHLFANQDNSACPIARNGENHR